MTEKITLRAGNLVAVFDPETAALRYLRLGKTEVLRGIYAAVRDKNWGTVPFELKNLSLKQQEDSFILDFDSVHLQNDIHFVWHGCITGKPDGTVSFHFNGEAKSSFRRNRIGFCVLHPMDAAGAACTIEHTDGRHSKGNFPLTISAQQPFLNIRSISHELANGLRAKVTLKGDTFEMEDQRNWTDASFKTYCTPLDDPFPVLVKKGEKLTQTITVETRGNAKADKENEATLNFSLTGQSTSLPDIGLGGTQRALDFVELYRLKQLKVAHLRVDLNLQQEYTLYLEQKISEATELACKLELAIHLSANTAAELQALKQRLHHRNVPIVRILIFHHDEKSTSKQTLELARSYLEDYVLVGGSNAFFTELNRERPDPNALDLVTYSLNPQVHAFDDASLVETLPAQAVTVASAETFCGAKPIILSPITFKMRFNPNATDDSSLNVEQQIDKRQHSLFGAAWTLGSLKYLLQTNVVSLTYFETAGKLGLMPDSKTVYPLYHVFADLAEYHQAEVMLSCSSHPLLIEGLCLRQGNKHRYMFTNFTTEIQHIRLDGLTGNFSGRVLDQTTLEMATKQPETFRSSSPLKLKMSQGFQLKLNPHAVLTIDGIA